MMRIAERASPESIFETPSCRSDKNDRAFRQTGPPGVSAAKGLLPERNSRDWRIASKSSLASRCRCDSSERPAAILRLRPQQRSGIEVHSGSSIAALGASLPRRRRQCSATRSSRPPAARPKAPCRPIAPADVWPGGLKSASIFSMLPVRRARWLISCAIAWACQAELARSVETENPRIFGSLLIAPLAGAVGRVVVDHQDVHLGRPVAGKPPRPGRGRFSISLLVAT